MILSTTARYGTMYHTTLEVARDEIKVRVLTLIFPSTLLAFFDLYPDGAAPRTAQDYLLIIDPYLLIIFFV